MKKTFALIVALCLLLVSFTASAAVLQNELAPELVAPEGAVLTDVHARGDVARLSAAYEAVMKGVHFSDVPCSEHEDLLKDDLNKLLEGSEWMAYDLLMYEMFDADVEIAEGETVELTVKEETAPDAVIFTADGLSWKVMEFSAANGNVTVKLDKDGVLAFLILPAKAYELNENYKLATQYSQIELEYDYTDQMHAWFTPSVSGKPAPIVISFTGSMLMEVVGEVVVPDGSEAIEVPQGRNLVVTSVADSKTVDDIQTHEHLEWAYEAISTAESFESIQPGLAAKIDAALAAQGSDLTNKDMVVRDLFEVTLYGKYLESFYQDGTYLEVTFDTAFSYANPPLVLFSADSVSWDLLPAEDVIVNADGTTTLHLEELGVVGFMVEQIVDLSAEEAVNSPE